LVQVLVHEDSGLGRQSLGKRSQNGGKDVFKQVSFKPSRNTTRTAANSHIARSSLHAVASYSHRRSWTV